MREPNRVPMQVRIRPALKERIQTYADAHTITLSRAAEILITQALNHQDQA